MAISHKNLTVVIISDDHGRALHWAQCVRSGGHEPHVMLTIDDFIEGTAHLQPNVVIGCARADTSTLLNCLRANKALDPLQCQVMMANDKQDELYAVAHRYGVDVVLPINASPQTLANTLEYLRDKSSNKAFERLPLTLDANKVVRYREGMPVKLTDFEAAALKAMLMSADGRLETWQLLEIAQHLGKDIEKPALEVLLTRLRKKLRTAGAPCDCIAAIRKWGYRLTT